MDSLTLRLAKGEDAPAIWEIYKSYGENTLETLDGTPPTCEEIEAQICTCQGLYPFLVGELDGKIVGYAYGKSHAPKQSFSWSALVNMYVHPENSGRGIGRALYDALEGVLREMGVVNLHSLVTFQPRGEYFQQARGYMEAGRLYKASFQKGKWRDLLYYEKHIALHEDAPQPVRPVGEIAPEKLEEIFNEAKKRVRR